MSHVLGISGVFLYADDCVSLKNWYTEHLGLAFECYGEDTCYGLDLPHTLPDGTKSHTVFSIMKAKAPLGSAPRTCMVNWRVRDLDQILEGLGEKGVLPTKQEDYEYGRFAWVEDPEGNTLELYQPLLEPGTF
jgi:predicted enzyme related to lactoylglutathione lyase